MSEILIHPGILAFAAVKGVGYGLLLLMVMKGASPVKSMGAALVRLILGMVLGVSILQSGILGHQTLIFYAAVMILRILEWAVIFKIFYPEEFRLHSVKLVGMGTACSTVLDAFALLSLFEVSGFIC